jgi:periplasmic protein TonB
MLESSFRKRQPLGNQPGTTDIWKKQIVAILERNKRYPSAAVSRGEQGVVNILLRVDRGGRLLAVDVVNSSRSELLDQEALEIVRRSEPFPPVPSDLAGMEIKLAVPIRFNLR